MTGHWRRWILGSIALPLLALVVAIAWLVATESGARWLIGQAQPYLPAALTLGESSGSLAGGLQVSPLRWRDDAVDVQVDNVAVEARLLPLLTGQLTISSLELRGVDIQLFETWEPEQSTEPLSVDLRWISCWRQLSLTVFAFGGRASTG